MMPLTTLDQKRRRLQIQAFEVSNDVVFSFFDKLRVDERDDALFRALYIGVLALMEDRLAAFLSKTESELGVRLESLKMIFEMKKEIFFRTALKGVALEEDIAGVLNDYFKARSLKDYAELTGLAAGALPKNKTGDIVCYVDGREDRRIVIECKFDKSLRLGDIKDRDISVRKTDSAWSQLLEAQVNRQGRIAVILLDVAFVDSSISRVFDWVGYIPNIGLVCIVDSQKGDFSNLLIAYNLARDIALNAVDMEFDGRTLSILVRRLISDIKNYTNVKGLVEKSIEINREILKQLEKSFLSVEFTESYLSKFLADGKLTPQDLLDFYLADEIREKFKPIEEDLKMLTTHED